MSKARIVIFSGHTIFTEGIASRLRQFSEEVDVSILDPEELEVIEKVGEAKPSAVIIDASEPNTGALCSLCQLLTTIKDLKVIRLHPEHSEVQIITSVHLQASDVHDLVELIDLGGL